MTLHFAELEPLSEGQRVFDVALEGFLVLDDYDITKAVGLLRADLWVFDVIVADGELELLFQASKGQPTLAGFELTRLPDSAFGVYCAGAPNSVGAGARLDFVGSTSVAQANCSLQASGLPPGKLALFVFGDAQAVLPFGSGQFCLGGSKIFSSALAVDAQGSLSTVLPTSQIPLGQDWNFQVIYLDRAPFRFNASDALKLHFTP